MEVILRVSNLYFGTEAQSLKDTFSEAGEVTKVDLPTDRESGKPRGFAFVTMSSKDAGYAAIEKFDGFTLDGRLLKVELLPPPDRYSGSGSIRVQREKDRRYFPPI